MTLRVFMHSNSKRANTVALLDSGATENFMSLQYAKYLQLPIKVLSKPQRLFNVDGTRNKAGDLKYYMDLHTRTGTTQRMLQYFLSDLGENRVILGYLWFAVTQPKINWARGWISHDQLPIVLRSPDTAKAWFLPRQMRPTSHTIVGRMVDTLTTLPKNFVPAQYQKHAHMFSEQESKKFPPKWLWDHAIKLKAGAPTTLISQNICLSQVELEELQKFIKEHVERGTIWPSKSPYAATFFFIKKKNGKLCPVQDYWPINEWTIKNHYPLPLIPQLIDQLRGCTLFTKFNIKWGYNNIWIKDGDQWKAVFTTNEELFKPTVMFFGLTNLPATFQTMMNTIFRDLIADGSMTVYMDNMVIHMAQWPDETEDDHVARHYNIVNQVLQKLNEHNLYLNPDKCDFELPHIDFLGVQVVNGTVQMEQGKVNKVKEWKPLQNVTEVRWFLGFTGYYQYFIQGYSQIAWPLLDLTKHVTPWHWKADQQSAFEGLCDKMCEKPVLRQPNFEKTFYLQTDVSAYGVGTVLSQEGESKNSKPKCHPICYVLSRMQGWLM